MSLVDNDNPTILGYLLDLRMDINIWSIHLPKSKIHRRPFVNLATCAIVFVLAIVLSAGNVFSFPGLDLAQVRTVARYGGAEQRAALLNRVRETGGLNETKGVEHALRETKRLGYSLRAIAP